MTGLFNPTIVGKSAPLVLRDSDCVAGGYGIFQIRSSTFLFSSKNQFLGEILSGSRKIKNLRKKVVPSMGKKISFFWFSEAFDLELVGVQTERATSLTIKSMVCRNKKTNHFVKQERVSRTITG